ncbi:hypothetical protein MKQ68_09680 [Chitinophaga horti]|uniref:Uncharacterized protein n=1 Tax=Chitinophaga horti TaxID=2920382 RepID=A0ABY6J6Z1_9BACT|nr:hypothetical protein [Chitinophaga horti]UYQ95367.1 hypothetical protein MKQ68_09680 [Chitinophaga horti]
MKKTLVLSSLALLIVCFSGCLTSLHPAFKAGDVFFDQRLLGTWKMPDDKDVLTFSVANASTVEGLPEELRKLSAKGYDVSVKDDDGTSRFLVFLFKLGNNTYMDFYPRLTAQQSTLDPFFMQHHVPSHILFKIKITGAQMDMSQLKAEFLAKLIEKNKLRIAHELQRNNGAILLTASTNELQQYILKYGDVADAFEESGHYKRLN